VEFVLDEDVIRRICVHFIVDSIPKDGLNEAAQLLRDIAHFYQPTVSRLPLPAPGPPVPATIVGTIDRPFLPIEME
jgi:hypothetical protein